MRILVTGAAGNIGKYLCEYLKTKHQVFRTDIIPDYADDYMLANVNIPTELTSVFNKFKPEVVFHLAAIYGRLANERYSYISVDTNIVGTNNIIQLCKEYDCKLIFFSTSEVYGNIGGDLHELRSDLAPNNRYGMLKLMCENLIKYEVKEYGLKAVIVRPNMVYSENEAMGGFRSAMIRFVESLLKGQKITVYKDSSRSWLHIEDAVKIFEQCIYIDYFETFNIASSENLPTTEFAKKVCNYIGVKYEDYVVEELTPERMTVEKNINNSLMKYKLGIPSISIDEGIKRVVDAVKNRIWVK